MGNSVAINDASHQILIDLQEKTGTSSTEIIEQALEIYRRKVFLEAVNKGYTVLRDDPEAWKLEQEERQTWDNTIGDGLPRNEDWSEDGGPSNVQTGES